MCGFLKLAARVVALLAEGVDRNSIEETLTRNPKRSPSSQRAWIEISTTPQGQPPW